MAKTPFSLIPILLLVISFLPSMFISQSIAVNDENPINRNIIMSSTDQCSGSMIECMESDEFEMSSEMNRRILITTQYISYGAMQANRVPCSKKGNSYYNCIPGGSANPYDRGCTSIARCGRY
ncbi:protein RALF-like 33 [Silene latifolia]|uniref:protein RALF-like 33 n=1 Tax=Silene latifolia TaxID=37657 RepID=UPI003D7871F8